MRLTHCGGPSRIRYGEAMRAITVVPGQQRSVALTDVPEPPPDDGPVVVQTQAVGICGTDLEIINGDYGWAPPGEERLVHRARISGPGDRVARGDRVRRRGPGRRDRAPA